ncbi:MAG: hypothetical protein HXX13_06070 [Bacteroidetes bacterium]|nr:hypothetical protein [Bacteroidota bacterium]
MKKKPKYIFLILAMMMCISIQAQEVQRNEQTVKASAEFDKFPSIDPKLPKIEGISSQASSINPTRPPAILPDPKLPNMELPGMHEISNGNSSLSKGSTFDAKLQPDGTLPPLNEPTPIIKIESKPGISAVKTSHDQVIGNAPKNSINFRNIKGPVSQPTPVHSVKTFNYRSIKGPSSQPTGAKPGR